MLIKFIDIGKKPQFRKSHKNHYWRFQLLRDGTISINVLYKKTDKIIEKDERINAFTEFHLQVLQESTYNISREKYYAEIADLVN